MTKKLRFLVLGLALAAAVANSCSKIHQFPVVGEEIDPTNVETRISVNCTVRLTGFNIHTQTRSTASPLSPEMQDSADFYSRRFIIDIYDNEYTDTLVESHTIFKEITDTSSLIIDAKLHTRKYKLVVWMDYVRKDELSDLYYITSNGLNNIHQPEPYDYKAGSEFKDAQTFMSDIDLTPYAGQWFADITILAPLERPMAKITFLASDLEEYAAQIGYTGSLEELADDILVEFNYSGYYPTGFNAHTGRLNDSDIGYYFGSETYYPFNLDKSYLEEPELEDKPYTHIGSDYVFVNGESSSVTVAAKIMFRDGRFINEVNNVFIPIIRGEETVVIYKFFTKEYVPGIGIDPGFDGEFNVYV